MRLLCHRTARYADALFFVDGRLARPHLFEDPELLVLIVLLLQSRVRTVQRRALHGCLLSDFALWTIRRVLEGVANFAEMEGG